MNVSDSDLFIAEYYSTVYYDLSNFLLIETIWIVSTLELLWVKQLQTFLYESLCTYILISLDKYVKACVSVCVNICLSL